MATFDLNIIGDDGLLIFGGAQDNLGSGMAFAGDINGDGFDDLIVGAQGDDTAYAYSGAVRIFHGGPDFPTGTLDVQLWDADAARDGDLIIGPAFSIRTGSSVGSGGDFNGDEIADATLSLGGLGVVILGERPSTARDIDLGDLPDPRVIGFNADTYAYAQEFTSIGDIDGDGFADVALGSRYATNGDDTSAGKVRVFTGLASPPDVFSPNDYAGDTLLINGENAYDQLGFQIAAAGDFNDDTFDDFIVSAPGYGSNTGAIYVVYGGPELADEIDLAGLTAAQGVKIIGPSTFDFFGSSIDGGADFDGDGIDDILVGARGAYGSGRGAVYVIFGGKELPNLIDLGAPQALLAEGDPLFIPLLKGDNFDRVGTSAAFAGDTDGDGHEDVVVGMPGHNYSAGGAVLVHGDGTRGQSEDLANPYANIDLYICSVPYSYCGSVVAGGFDINGDGLSDFALASEKSDDGGVDSGSVFVIFGRSAAPPPDAVDDEAETDEDSTITVDVVANDTPGSGGGALVLQAAQQSPNTPGGDFQIVENKSLIQNYFL